MLKIVCFAVIMMFVLPLHSHESGLKPDSNAAAEAEIKALEMELAKLMVKADWSQYASHLADDYVRVGTNGQMQTKGEVLADLRSDKNKLLDLIPEDLQAKLYGDTAILNAHLTMLSRQNARVTTTFHRTTEVFVRRGDKWWIVALSDVPIRQ